MLRNNSKQYRDSYQLWNCECRGPTHSFLEVYINRVNCHNVTIKLTKAKLIL